MGIEGIAFVHALQQRRDEFLDILQDLAGAGRGGERHGCGFLGIGRHLSGESNQKVEQGV